MWAGDADQMAAVRDEAIRELGGDATVDAIAVSAMFHMMTRIADGTGTPIDAGTVDPSEEIRAAIGVNDFVSRRHAPT